MNTNNSIAQRPTYAYTYYGIGAGSTDQNSQTTRKLSGTTWTTATQAANGQATGTMGAQQTVTGPANGQATGAQQTTVGTQTANRQTTTTAQRAAVNDRAARTNQRATDTQAAADALSATAAQAVTGTQSTTAAQAVDTGTRSRQTGAAAVYEPSQRLDRSQYLRSPTEMRNLAIQLREDLTRRMNSFQNLADQMLGRQSATFNLSLDGGQKDFWSVLQSGKIVAGADTQEEAQDAVSEDGYWGVAQTSDRLVKYATALSGGDSAKMEKMAEAFEKGYQAAAKAWGGTLPDIAQQTRQAVQDKFQALREQDNQTASGSQVANAMGLAVSA